MRLLRLLPIALVYNLVALDSQAASYDFVVIASSTGGAFSGLQASAPSLDANGALAFVAQVGNGFAPTVFVGSQFACSQDEYVQISGLPAQPSLNHINGIGRMLPTQVAFGATTSIASGVYRGSGGPLSTIYTYSGGFPLPLSIAIDEPAVDSDGTLALIVSGSSSADEKVQIADEEDVTTLVSVGDDLPNGQHISAIFTSAPDIDELGHVLFDAEYLDPTGTTCNEKLIRTTGDAAVVAEVAAGGFASGCPYAFVGSSALALNAEGQVAFGAPFGLNLVKGVFLDETAVWNEDLPGFGDSPLIDAEALNDSGLVAFQLETNPTHEHSVYLALGEDPAEDKVLALGDSLCGSIVTDVGFHRFGLNDAGQLALFVTLADGRLLVVRADPSTGQGGQCETTCGKTTWPAPEPDAQILAVTALVALLGVANREAGRLRTRRAA